MAKIQNETAYKAAMERIEELLPLVDDNTPLNRKSGICRAFRLLYYDGNPYTVYLGEVRAV